MVEEKNGENKKMEPWQLPGVEEDILGCKNPGSASCSSERSGACAGWTRYSVLASSCRGEVCSFLLE